MKTAAAETATDEPTIVHVDGIRRTSAAGETLLEIRAFSLHPGERVGVLGDSGSGKTLFLRALAGIDPFDRGELRSAGRAVAGSDFPAFRRRVALVPQRPRFLDETVADALRAPFSYATANGRPWSEEEAVAWLERLGRPKALLGRRCRDLSGGEASSVALTRALLVEPTALLLDEPTAALDGALRRNLDEVLRLWMEGGERAIVRVEHDRDALRAWASRVVVVERGQVQEPVDGEPT